MIDIEAFISEHGELLKMSWAKNFWYRSSIMKMVLDKEELYRALKDGILTNWAVAHNGKRLFKCSNGEEAIKANQAGSTLLVRETNLLWPTLTDIGTQLGKYLGVPYSDTSIVLSSKEVSGFSLHMDPYDLLIVQISGDKEWELYDLEYARVDPVILRAGDVFHLPRHHRHAAVPLTDCCHLAFKFK